MSAFITSQVIFKNLGPRNIAIHCVLKMLRNLLDATQAYSHSTWEAEAEGSFQGHPYFLGETETSLGYMSPYLKTPYKTKQTNKNIKPKFYTFLLINLLPNII